MQPKEIIGNYFVEGLRHETIALLNASAQGQIINKTYEEMEALLELMSEGVYEYQETSRVGLPQKADGVCQVDNVAAIRGNIGTLLRRGGRFLNVSKSNQFNIFRKQHTRVMVSLMLILIVLKIQNVYYVGQYNHGGGNQGNYFGNNYNQQYGKQDFYKQNNYQNPQAQIVGSLVEDTKKQFIAQQQVVQQQNQKVQSKIKKSIHELERQVGQMVISQNVRPQGALLSDKEKNPRDFKAVTLMNGRTKAEKIVEKEMQEPERVVTRPPSPFPQRFQKRKIDAACKKFLDILKKDVVANKRHWTEFETVTLTEECSSRVRSKIPPKLKYPGSFTISITIGNIEVGLALCDLDASINLIPTFVFRTLGWVNQGQTTVTLQLADRCLSYPNGIIEDVLMKVDPFILLGDFIILDYEADKNVSLIMGRGFLATVDAVIRVRDGKMAMTVDGQEVTFDVQGY
ncbi:uncharacterized protein LOC132631164 [Lycium barbarum]|uniref:uncharacterized protein LOC132631164 n=1 Tax=Lycium barbarum TaxID=112863 RepID=UPI00293EF0EF|nr:uncharacterized protein LOC132631164 [Lycium barbarum]